MKPSWMFWLLVALWAGAGGPACTRDSSKDAPVPPPRPCNLLISGTSIQYNGRALPLPSSLEAWEQVLGPHARKVEVADDVYVWDQLGIYSIASTSSTVLRTWGCRTRPRKHVLPSLSPTLLRWPRTTAYRAAALAISTARRMASGVAGEASSTGVRGGPKAATACRSAVTAPMASMNGGSPTALLP